jgi:hypothetical protein
MPNVQIQVGVSVSNAKTGKLEIEIKPWRAHVAAGDTLEWALVAHNTDDIVSWVRIDTVSHTDPWPFPEAPPDAAYTGTHLKHAKTPHGRKGGLTVGSVVPYTIAIAFTDDNGNERYASVDPDMVMD